MLQNYIKEKEIDIVIIAEPVNIPDGNWAGSDNKGSAICWSNKIRERIKVVFNGNDFVAIELGEIVIFSCYISPKKIEGILWNTKGYGKLPHTTRKREAGYYRRFQRTLDDLGI